MNDNMITRDFNIISDHKNDNKINNISVIMFI